MLTPGLHRILLTPRNPFILGFKISSGTASPLTIDIPPQKAPRHNGWVAISNIGGTATPSTPSGWTSTGSAAATASVPGLRMARRLFDGTVTATTSSTMTGVTQAFAVTFVFANMSPIQVIVDASATGTSTAPDPGNAVAFGGHSALFIHGFFAASSTITVTRPPGLPDNFTVIQSNGLTLAFGTAFSAPAFNPGAWTISASVGWRAFRARVASP